MMNALSIGGFDPSCASGIQRDMRVASSLGLYPLSVATTITTQNTSEFGVVHPLSVHVISSQLNAVLSDFKVDVIKVGMLYTPDIIHAIHDRLCDVSAPVILDPVVRSTTGGSLLQHDAKDTLLDVMLPRSFIVTPNLYEAKYLTDVTHDGLEGAQEAAKLLHQHGADNVVVTGVKENDEIVDVLYNDDGFQHIRGARLYGDSRGGGCTYSAALSCFVISDSVAAAAKRARLISYTAQHVPISAGKTTPIASEIPTQLESAINDVMSIPDMYRLIPQCQTNFVHAPIHATTPDEVFGIQGRLVRAGKRVVMAGVISPNGSKHVSAAVCAIRGRFSNVRSAINIRYSQDILSLLIRARLTVVFYDRTSEPPEIKESGSSISWGVSWAAAQCMHPPDAICHRGDFGKEPMIILFGDSPNDVVSKIGRLFS